MPQPKKKQAPQTERGKVEAKLITMTSQEVVDGINEADEEACKAKLSALATYENETETALKTDEDIARMKEELKEAQAPMKDTLKGIKLQRSLIGYRLEELGKA